MGSNQEDHSTDDSVTELVVGQKYRLQSWKNDEWPTFDVEILVKDCTLTVDDVWPDGDGPMMPTAADVRDVMRKSAASVTALVTGFALQATGFEPNMEQTEAVKTAMRAIFALLPCA